MLQCSMNGRICGAVQHSDEVAAMAHAENYFETYAASTKSAFDYWVSFFPTAPMFGVDWRFGEFAFNGNGSTATDAVETVEESASQVIETPELLAERPETVDALTSIKGVGPGLEKQLHALGIYTFAQLADLNDAQLAWLDDNLMTVKGRCIRDDWSGQAKALMS